MCDLCYSNPHLPGCPNAPEPKHGYKCSYCGGGIVEGEYFYDIDGRLYHDDCLDEMSREEILELVGIDKEEE